MAKSFWWKKEKKKRQYGWEPYKNLADDKKQRLVEYRKKSEKWENKTASQIRLTEVFWLATVHKVSFWYL